MQVWGCIILAGIAAAAWWKIEGTLEANWRAEQAALAEEVRVADEQTAHDLESTSAVSLRDILRDAVEKHRLIQALPVHEGELEICPANCRLPPLQ